MNPPAPTNPSELVDPFAEWDTDNDDEDNDNPRVQPTVHTVDDPEVVPVSVPNVDVRDIKKSRVEHPEGVVKYYRVGNVNMELRDAVELTGHQPSQFKPQRGTTIIQVNAPITLINQINLSNSTTLNSQVDHHHAPAPNVNIKSRASATCSFAPPPASVQNDITTSTYVSPVTVITASSITDLNEETRKSLMHTLKAALSSVDLEEQQLRERAQYNADAKQKRRENNETEQRQSYTVSEKIYYVRNGRFHVGCPKKTPGSSAVSNWRNDMPFLLEWASAGRGEDLKMRRPTVWGELYRTTYSLYIAYRDNGDAITTCRLREWMERDEHFNKISLGRKRANVLYFLSIYRLTIRCVTGVPQICPSDWSARILSYNRRLMTACRTHQFYWIAFGDETFVLRHPTVKKVVTERGKKHVSIKKFGDKEGATVFLMAAMCLPWNGPLETNESIDQVKPKLCKPFILTSASQRFAAKKDCSDCLIGQTDSGWMNSDAMMHYLEKSDLPKCTAQRKGLMIWDLHASHRCDQLLAKLKAMHWEVIFVPGGTTGDCQVMDTHVNRSFKAKVRELYERDKQADAAVESLEIDDDKDDAEKNEKVLPKEAVKKETKYRHSVRKLSARVREAWDAQTRNVINGFLHNIARYTRPEAMPRDGDDVRRVLARLQVRQDAEKAFLLANKRLVDEQGYNSDEDKDEANTDLFAFTQAPLVMGKVKDLKQIDAVNVSRYEQLVDCLEKKCSYCHDLLTTDIFNKKCTTCAISFHASCARNKSIEVIRENPKFSDSLCLVCNNLVADDLMECCFCHSADKANDRCAERDCIFMMHHECGIEHATTQQIEMKRSNRCKYHQLHQDQPSNTTAATAAV